MYIPDEHPRTTILYITLNVYTQYISLICKGSNQSNCLKLL